MGNVCDRWLGCCCFGGTAKEASLQYVLSKHRNCTDVLFLVLYVASWVGLIATLIVAARRGGDPNRIYHGVNFNGSVCGKSADVSDKPYVAWVAMPQTPSAVDDCDNCYQIMTCLADCSATTSDPLMIDHYDSERLMYYCIPTVHNAQNISFAYETEFNTATNLASRAFTDLYTVWPAILIAAFGALLLSFVYALLAKHFAGLLVLTSIAALLAGGFLMSYALLKMAADADSTTVSTRSEAMRGIGIAIAVLTVLFLLIVIGLRKRIYVAVEVMKEASRAVLDLFWIIFFPLLPFLVGCGYFVLFIVTTLYIGSVWTSTSTPLPPYIADNGNERLGQSYELHAWDQSLKNNFAFVFFHLLWTVQCLVYLTFMVVAGTVASWYFTPRDAKGSKLRGAGEGQLSYFPVLAAVYRTLRFHSGTIALAALIIAVIEFIRVIVKYSQTTTTATPHAHRPEPAGCTGPCTHSHFRPHCCSLWSLLGASQSRRRRPPRTAHPISCRRLCSALSSAASPACSAAWTRSTRTRSCGSATSPPFAGSLSTSSTASVSLSVSALSSSPCCSVPSTATASLRLRARRSL